MAGDVLMFTWSHILWQLYSWCWQCWRDRACYMSHRVTSRHCWHHWVCDKSILVSVTNPSHWKQFRNGKALIFNEFCTSFWPLNLTNVTNSRDVVKLILLQTFFTLWCLFDDMADIHQGKAHFYNILRPRFLLKTWQYACLSNPCVLLFVICVKLIFNVRAGSLVSHESVMIPPPRLTTYWYWSLYHKFDLRSIFWCRSAIIAT